MLRLLLWLALVVLRFVALARLLEPELELLDPLELELDRELEPELELDPELDPELELLSDELRLLLPLLLAEDAVDFFVVSLPLCFFFLSSSESEPLTPAVVLTFLRRAIATKSVEKRVVTR